MTGGLCALVQADRRPGPPARADAMRAVVVFAGLVTAGLVLTFVLLAALAIVAIFAAPVAAVALVVGTLGADRDR